MQRIVIVFALASCNKGLAPVAHPAQSDASHIGATDERASFSPELGSGEPEPARIGPPVGNGPGSRRISTRDDATPFQGRERLAEMDSVSSLDGK